MLKTNYKTQVYDSITYGCFRIGFINFMLKVYKVYKV